MNILVLSKRQYMRRDLLLDRYGRFYELPLELANLGNKVRVLCMSYRRCSSGSIHERTSSGGEIEIVSCNALGELARYGSYLRETISKQKPDCILACSDAFQIILGIAIGKLYGIPVVTDLYDNFESYPATNFPGVGLLFRLSLRAARGVVCVSRPLQEKIKKTSDSPSIVLENAVDLDRFRWRDKVQARKKFDLPAGATIIGTSGLIHRDKDISSLIEAYSQLKSRYERILLVLAGPFEEDIKVDLPEGVVLLGDLDYERIPGLLNCLDVGVVSVKDDSFGQYCFPQKACEFVASQVPVVAANIGALAEKLSDIPEALYQPGSSEGLARALTYQIESRVIPRWEAASWRQQAESLDGFIHQCMDPPLDNRCN